MHLLIQLFKQAYNKQKSHFFLSINISAAQRWPLTLMWIEENFKWLMIFQFED